MQTQVLINKYVLLAKDHTLYIRFSKHVSPTYITIGAKRPY